MTNYKDSLSLANELLILLVVYLLGERPNPIAADSGAAASVWALQNIYLSFIGLLVH